jgi:hypothetical protein
MLANAQTQELRNFGIAEVFRGGDSIFIKKLRTVVVNVSEGKITKMRTPPDSATLFIAPDGLVYEGTTVWRKVGTTPSIEVIVDDTDPANVYSTPWTKKSVANGDAWTSVFEKQTCSYINTAGATLTYTFTGKRIEVWQEKTNNKGMIAISLGPGTTASGAETTIDLYAATGVNNTQKVWESAELNPGTYTIKIRVTGTKVAASSNTYSVHDYFKVIK